MTKEIVEAVQTLEKEKGISAEKLMLALEDALLSAYKKTPGAAKYARVDMDRNTADFRVFELLVPRSSRRSSSRRRSRRSARSTPRPASCASPKTRRSTPRSSLSTATRSAAAT